ncbi:MAG: DUF58 domain-containing protein [Hyphomicrobium sp.]
MASPAHSRTDAADSSGVLALEREAHGLADRLPELLITAQRIAQTVAHGLHGRRRAGPGETFWQFRQFQSSDTLRQIDWRRSASSDHLYVREREWEAAHTVWMWSDLSASMNFRSHLATTTKRERAVLLMLGAAELLVRGGERVALLGLTPPTASRKATTRMAEAILAHEGTPLLEATQPPRQHLARFSGAILIGDFLDPIDTRRAPTSRRWRPTAPSAISSRSSIRQRKRSPTKGAPSFSRPMAASGGPPTACRACGHATRSAWKRIAPSSST